MPGNFLDIKAMMRAVDSRDKTWYDRLSDDDKKLYSPYMSMKWTAAVEHKEQAIQEFYIEEVMKMSTSICGHFQRTTSHCCGD